MEDTSGWVGFNGSIITSFNNGE
ncbi:hypothetical protein NC651_023231 [Populus alba x Populus x berolinensis]|nr:hypothetical protein NC651_023231 [Populus alba x Populus x berolinensis]